MGQKSKKIDDIMADAQNVTADDPDMMEKLNLIALKVAEAQGKVLASAKSKNNNFNIDTDPMDELGCEGCQ